MVVSVVVVVVVLFDASLLPVVEVDEPLGVVVVLVLPGVVVVLALPEGVVVVVVDEVEDEPVDASAGLLVSAGFTSTFVEEDDEGGVLVSVLEQPTTPTPTARMAARRYDDFIFRVPSSVVVQEAHWLLRDAALRNGPSGGGRPARNSSEKPESIQNPSNLPSAQGSESSQISSKRWAKGTASAGECSATMARGCS